MYLLIRDVRFGIDGGVTQEVPVGMGLIVPGAHVPERFNREAGFFKLSDIDALLKQNGRPPLDINIQRGFPLKSWNIQLTGSELL